MSKPRTKNRVVVVVVDGWIDSPEIPKTHTRRVKSIIETAGNECRRRVCRRRKTTKCL